MSSAAGGTEIWQARIDPDLAAQLRADSEILGLRGRTDIVRAALHLLHRRATEERMARDFDAFYGEATAPLPIGVVPADEELVTDHGATGPDATR